MHKVEEESHQTKEALEKEAKVRSTEIGKEKDGNSIDEVESVTHPAYVPRKPRYFLHELRCENSENEDDIVSRKTKSSRDKNWQHDKFIEKMQQPKSKEELIMQYGYDIREQSVVTDESMKLNIKSNFSKPKYRFGRKGALRRQGRRKDLRQTETIKNFNDEKDEIKDHWKQEKKITQQFSELCIGQYNNKIRSNHQVDSRQWKLAVEGGKRFSKQRPYKKSEVDSCEISNFSD